MIPFFVRLFFKKLMSILIKTDFNLRYKYVNVKDLLDRSVIVPLINGSVFFANSYPVNTSGSVLFLELKESVLRDITHRWSCVILRRKTHVVIQKF